MNSSKEVDDVTSKNHILIGCYAIMCIAPVESFWLLAIVLMISLVAKEAAQDFSRTHYQKMCETIVIGGLLLIITISILEIYESNGIGLLSATLSYGWYSYRTLKGIYLLIEGKEY